MNGEICLTPHHKPSVLRNKKWMPASIKSTKLSPMFPTTPYYLECLSMMLCLSTSMDLIDWFHDELARKFSITIKVNVDSFLGIQIFCNRSSKIISLSQPGYISAFMDKFKIDTTSTTSYPTCPMSSSDLLDPAPISLSPLEQSLYMKMVCSVLHVLVQIYRIL